MAKQITRFFKRAVPEPTLDLPVPKRRSLIDQLGLGPQVVQLRKAGLTAEDIALQLGLKPHQVAQWIWRYRSKLSEEQRLAVHKKSVFDVADRLQEVCDYLYEVLDRVRRKDEDLGVKTSTAIMKSLQMAGDLMEKVQVYEENKRFREVILDLLDKEAPGIKAKAMQRLNEMSKTHVSLLRGL